MEFWPTGLKNLDTDPEQLLENLAGQRFKTFIVEDEVRPAGREEILREARQKGYINILFTRN